jgi:hypothetical protein
MLKARIAHLELRTQPRFTRFQFQLLDGPLREVLADPHAENRAGCFIGPLPVDARGNHIGVAMRLNPRVAPLVAHATRLDRRADMHAHAMMLERRDPVQSGRHVDHLRTKTLPAERLAGTQYQAGTTVRLQYRCHGIHCFPSWMTANVCALCCVFRRFA